MSATVHQFPYGIDGERVLADDISGNSHYGIGRGLIERPIEPSTPSFVSSFIYNWLAGMFLKFLVVPWPKLAWYAFI